MKYEDPEDFVQDLKEAVISVCKSYELFPSVCMAQACIESSYGKSIIGEYNCFGMKDCGDGNTIVVTTEEELEDGSRETIDAKFQLYYSFEDAVKGYCENITLNKAYADAVAEIPNGRDAFIDAFAGVYATDSSYAKLIKTVIADWGFDELDDY